VKSLIHNLRGRTRTLYEGVDFAQTTIEIDSHFEGVDF